MLKPLPININQLKVRTKMAIKGAEIAREVVEQRNKEKEKLAEKITELKAQEIIFQVPFRCEQEASAGRSFAIIMSFSSVSGDMDHNGPPYNICEPEWLRGVARLVYDACVEAELKPTLEYWFSGDGMDAGFNVVVHW